MPYVYVPGAAPGYQPQDQLAQLRAAQAQAAYQPQPAAPGIIWVQGEGGAKSYMVAPGSSVMLMDSEGQSFYIKSSDASGMPLPLRIFDYQERAVQQAAQPPIQTPAGQDFATRAEVAEIGARLAALEAGACNHTPDGRMATERAREAVRGHEKGEVKNG